MFLITCLKFKLVRFFIIRACCFIDLEQIFEHLRWLKAMWLLNVDLIGLNLPLTFHRW